MNSKEIQRDIKKTLDAWLKTIPWQFKDLAKNHVFVSGGCIASMLLGETVQDYDLYFKDVNTARLLAEYYTARLGHGNVDVQENRVVLGSGCLGYRLPQSSQLYSPMFFSQNAITLTGGIQIILRFCGDIANVHKTFDFAHTKNYFTYDEGLVLDKAGLESLLTRELVYSGSGFPIAALFRVHKFMRRKWKIKPAELMKIVYDIAQLDVTDPNVIKEQLGGYYGKDVADQLEGSAKLSRETFFSALENLTSNGNNLGNYK